MLARVNDLRHLYLRPHLKAIKFDNVLVAICTLGEEKEKEKEREREREHTMISTSDFNYVSDTGASNRRVKL